MQIPVFLYSASPTVLDVLLHKHHFSPEVPSLVDSDLTDSLKADSVLSYLRINGFSITQLKKLVQYMPQYSAEEAIKPKIKIFQDLSHLSILHSSVNNSIVHSLTLLKGLLGSNHDLARLLWSCAWFVTTSLEKNTVPNIEFLKSYDIPMERILIILYNNPRVLAMMSDEACERILIILYNNPRVLAMMSDEAWERKLQAFRDLGFSDIETLAMFRKASPLFTKSMEKINIIKELALEIGKFNMSSIVNNPMSFACSIENRYKPRLEVLRILESRRLINCWPL
ncbi:hypothetical protein ABFS83_03G019800 [Erythranthe nasuta]